MALREEGGTLVPSDGELRGAVLRRKSTRRALDRSEFELVNSIHRAADAFTRVLEAPGAQYDPELKTYLENERMRVRGIAERLDAKLQSSLPRG